MDERADQLLRTIASEHGVGLGRDDPILIVHTMVRVLLEQQQQEMAASLEGFKEILQDSVSGYQRETKALAEKALTAYLARLQKDGDAHIAKLSSLLDESVSSMTSRLETVAEKTTDRIQFLARIAGGLSLLSAIAIIGAFFFRVSGLSG